MYVISPQIYITELKSKPQQGLGVYAASKAAVHGKLSLVDGHENILLIGVVSAITESLMGELAPFNIKVTLVQPGAFRTEGIYGQAYFTTNPVPAYDQTRAISMARFASVPGHEKGDPDKAAEVIVDVVRGEGVAKGRPWPPYLFLGEDAEADVRSKCSKILATVDQWADVARAVSFDESNPQN